MNRRSPLQHTVTTPSGSEPLKAGYRGDGPLPRAILCRYGGVQRRARPHLASPLALCRARLPDSERGRLADLGHRHRHSSSARGADGDVPRLSQHLPASRLARVQRGARQQRLLVCPYHAWTYELDGRLRTPTEREFGVHQSKLGLHPVALKDLGGLLFVALGHEPVASTRRPPKSPTRWRTRGSTTRKSRTRIRYTVEANWKLDLREQSRVLPLRQRASRVRQGHIRHRALYRGKPARGRAPTALATTASTHRAGRAEAASTMTGAYWRVRARR